MLPDEPVMIIEEEEPNMFDTAAIGIKLDDSFFVEKKEENKVARYETNQYIATFSSEDDYRDATLSEEEERKKQEDRLTTTSFMEIKGNHKGQRRFTTAIYEN